MEDQEILEIVKTAFANNITSWANETILGLESGIEGKDDFLNEIAEQLKLRKG